MKIKNRCMMCSYFKTDDKDLPDFGICTKNNFEVVSSDLACPDFVYALKNRKVNDKCPRCKHCLGMAPNGMYSCSYANDGSELSIGIEVVFNCANFEEVNMNKVEGKVSDFCPKCKNCKGITHNYDGTTAKITEVECEDPYDGMVKTLQVDSDICCSMFEQKPPCEKCERFDGTYCHRPDGIFVTSYMALFGEPGNCPSYEEKKEEEPFNLNMSREQLEAKILDLFEEKNRLNGIINKLEKEKTAHLKGIERLKKSQEKLQNQVKNLQSTNEESYKREEELEDKCHKLERRLLDENKRFDRLYNEFLMPLARVLYPGEKVNKPYSDILEDIKELRLEKTMKMRNYENELTSLNTINKGLAEDRKKLINYIRSLKIASENYLKEFTYEED